MVQLDPNSKAQAVKPSSTLIEALTAAQSVTCNGSIKPTLDIAPGAVGNTGVGAGGN